MRCLTDIGHATWHVNHGHMTVNEARGRLFSDKLSYFALYSRCGEFLIVIVVSKILLERQILCSLPEVVRQVIGHSNGERRTPFRYSQHSVACWCCLTSQMRLQTATERFSYINYRIFSEFDSAQSTNLVLHFADYIDLLGFQQVCSKVVQNYTPFQYTGGSRITVGESFFFFCFQAIRPDE